MANLHISATTEIGDTGTTLLELLNDWNQKHNPHYIEIVSTSSRQDRYIQLGRADDHPFYGKQVYKDGYNNEMHEYYCGVTIPDISKYYMLLVEVNSGGNGESQLNGGIYLYDNKVNQEDTIYSTNWKNQILMPKSNNYTKICLTKCIYVGNRNGSYTVCALLSTYSGTNIYWNTGFGDEGTTMKVVGFLK